MVVLDVLEVMGVMCLSDVLGHLGHLGHRPSWPSWPPPLVPQPFPLPFRRHCDEIRDETEDSRPLVASLCLVASLVNDRPSDSSDFRSTVYFPFWERSHYFLFGNAVANQIRADFEKKMAKWGPPGATDSRDVT